MMRDVMMQLQTTERNPIQIAVDNVWLIFLIVNHDLISSDSHLCHVLSQTYL